MITYGGTEYVVTYESGRTISAWAFDEEGAEFIAANTSAQFGWGKIASMEAQS